MSNDPRAEARSTAAVGSNRELNAELVTELAVRDVALSIRFYEKAGFYVERATATFASLRWGDSYLFLAQAAKVSPGVPPANIRVIVSDLAPWIERARGEGWVIVSAPADRGYGLRDFTVLDPDGHELRFAVIANG